MRYILFFILLTQVANANILKINVSPERPVLDEIFNVEFTLNVDTEDEPVINFNVINLDVVSKSSPQVATRATYIGGKVTINKSITYVYEMKAQREGSAYINNISINVGGKNYKHQSKLITITKDSVKEKSLFARAEVEKESVYVGESIVVRYYLYNRADIGIRNVDIKKFPKLDKFLKRFHQEDMKLERVNIGGKIYERRIMYTAQLFAQGAGDYRIDPITMNISYSTGGDSLNSFGFNLRLGRQRSTTLISPEVKIKAVPVPIESMPKNFTGLVGSHNFKLEMNRNKFIVNEPIELQLTVTGNGALELYEAPVLISNQNVEEFEKSGDLAINKNFTAEKKFKYTYLPRESFKEDARKVELSYFNIEENNFKTVTLDIPSLEVAGRSNRVAIEKTTSSANTTDEKINDGSASLYNSEWKAKYLILNTYLLNLKNIFILCSLLLLMYGFYILIKIFKGREIKDLSPFDDIYKNGVTYSKFFRIFNQIDDSNKIQVIINKLEVDESTKKYLLKLLDDLEGQYNQGEKRVKIKVNKKYFRKIEEIAKV